jgi:hypothetical protein
MEKENDIDRESYMITLIILTVSGFLAGIIIGWLIT